MIKIKNKGVFKDEIIGCYEFDSTQIYFNEDHTIYHQWLAFYNPESVNMTEVSGLLRVSISVLSEGDN